MPDPRRCSAVLFLLLTVCPATLAQNINGPAAADRYNATSVWVLLAALLVLSVVLNLTGKVEPFVTNCEKFLRELIRIPYLVLHKFRQVASRRLGEEAHCTPSNALAGLFFLAVVIGAGIANFGIVRMSLEAFLPNPEALSMLSAIFVMAKGGAGWLFHILVRNASHSRAAKLACVAVLVLFLLSCTLDAGITTKRVSLIEAVNSGTPFTGDVATQFSENAALMAGINLLMSCLEFVFAYAAFHFASKPISWLIFSPVLLPAFVLELSLGVIHKSKVTGALGTLFVAVLTAPKIIALGVIDLVRSVKRSLRQTAASLITSLRERKIRKARLHGEWERAQLRQADETGQVRHTKAINDAKRAAALESQQAEIRFEAQELAANFTNRHKINSLIREKALSVASENVRKTADAFNSIHPSQPDFESGNGSLRRTNR